MAEEPYARTPVSEALSERGGLNIVLRIQILKQISCRFPLGFRGFLQSLLFCGQLCGARRRFGGLRSGSQQFTVGGCGGIPRRNRVRNFRSSRLVCLTRRRRRLYRNSRTMRSICIQTLRHLLFPVVTQQSAAREPMATVARTMLYSPFILLFIAQNNGAISRKNFARRITSLQTSLIRDRKVHFRRRTRAFHSNREERIAERQEGLDALNYSTKATLIQDCLDCQSGGSEISWPELSSQLERLH